MDSGKPKLAGSRLGSSEEIGGIGLRIFLVLYNDSNCNWVYDCKILLYLQYSNLVVCEKPNAEEGEFTQKIKVILKTRLSMSGQWLLRTEEERWRQDQWLCLYGIDTE